MIKIFRVINKIHHYIHSLLADLVLQGLLASTTGKYAFQVPFFLFLLKPNSLEYNLYLLKEGSGKLENLYLPVGHGIS